MGIPIDGRNRMDRSEIKEAANRIADGICHPFSPEWDRVQKAARLGILKGLEEAANAEKVRLVLADIDAGFDARKRALR
jgi:hypothetical protein